MSKNYILPEIGNDYKANLHCHTTISDGTMTPNEIKDYYMANGYSIVAYTDHELFVPHLDLCDDSFCALGGYEMSFYDYDTTTDFNIMRTTHINFIALDPKLIIQPFFHRERYFIGNGVKNKHLIKFDESEPDFVRKYTPECINMVLKECKNRGFFAIYNHPCWSLENYPIYSNYNEMNALEMMNGGSITEGYIENNFQVYDDLLLQGKKIGSVAGDDNHAKHDSLICWTMIRARDLSYNAVADALKNGDYYATNGPVIKEFYEQDKVIHIKTSDAKNIVFSTNCRHAKNVYNADGTSVNEAQFELNDYDKYVRVTVFGTDGTVAYSSAYFIDR